MGATRNTGYLENLIQYDASDNVAIATTVNPSYKVTLGGSMLGTSAVFSSSVSVNGSTSVDSLTVNRNAANNTGGITLYNADTGGYGSAVTFRVNYAGVYNTGRIHGDWGAGNTGILHFFTANTSQALVERMTINGSGNVGIGTTNPEELLELSSSNTTGGQFLMESTGSTTGNYAGMRFKIAGGSDGGYEKAGIFAVRGSGGYNDLSLVFATNTAATTANVTTSDERMRITSGGNVGINRTPNTSTGILQIKHTDANFYSGLSVYGTTADNFTTVGHTGSVGVISATYNSTGSYTPLAFYTSDTERMRITSGGNIAIGNTTVNNVVANRTILELNGTSTALFNLSISGSRLGYLYHNGTNVEIGNEASGGAIEFNTAGSNRMRITSGGSVGIGNSNTAVVNITGTGQPLLQIANSSANGQLRVGGTDATGIGLVLDYTNAGNTISTIRTLYATSNDLCALNIDSGYIAFRTGSSYTEKLRIKANGQMYNSNAPLGDWAQYIGGNSTSGSSYGLVVEAGTTSGDNSFLVRKRDGTVNYLRIRGDGGIYLSNYVYNSQTAGSPRSLYISGPGEDYYIGGLVSTRAAKKNIENASNVDWIYQLNPVTYNYRKRDEDGKYTEDIYEDLNYGLIAEDTVQVADFLVNYKDNSDGTKEIIGIEYARLITPLLKAIQEIKAENDQQKADIESLKALINK